MRTARLVAVVLTGGVPKQRLVADISRRSLQVLNESSRELLSKLAGVVRTRMLPLVATGQEALAVGELWQSLEMWTDG